MAKPTEVVLGKEQWRGFTLARALPPKDHNAIFRVLGMSATGGGKKPYPSAQLVISARGYLAVALDVLRTGGIDIISDNVLVAAHDTLEVRPESEQDFDPATRFTIKLLKLNAKQAKTAQRKYASLIDPR